MHLRRDFFNFEQIHFDMKNLLPILQNIAQHLPNQLTDADKESLENIYQESLQNLDHPEAMFGFVLAKAMRQYLLGGQSNEHIYLQKFEIPQIRLFELLIQQLPLASLTQTCANALLVLSLKKFENPVLMDIGIGTGMQIVNVLQELAKQPDCQIKQLTVVGVEPFAEALQTAQHNLTNLLLPFKVNFVSHQALIENMTFVQIETLLPTHYDTLVINASFALHHIQKAADREKVFSYIQKLSPQVFLLSEPVSDHFEPHYGTRFRNAALHYGLVFEVIDTLEITPKEKAALKLFFSREIDDVLGQTESLRVEKQYATSQWLQLFKQTGFVLQKPLQLFENQEIQGAILKVNLPEHYAVVFKNEEITNVFYAQPFQS